MPDFLRTLLTSGGFIPHGHWYLWKPDLVWLHASSDALIALAYYSIPLMLVYFVYKRRDVPFNWIFLMFGSFIIACGTTHLMEIWTLWHPTYWLAGWIKAFTAIASLVTAVLLSEWIPKALVLPSPAELEAANLALRKEMLERQQMEEALRNSEQRFRATFNQAAVGIAEVEMNGRWRLVNQKLCEITGYTGEELLEQIFQDITHPDDLNSDLEYIGRMLAGEISTYSTEKRYIRKDTSQVWINLTGSVVRDDAGEPRYFIAIVQDISDRKRFQQEILQLNQDLERRVVERTAQLEVANRELEAFSYSVSHDLRAPLRSIDGFSQAFLERYADTLDEKSKHYLHRIRANSQRMGELIDDLLELSRVTRTEMRRTEVDLSAIASEIAIELRQSQPERHVEFAIAPGIVAQGDARLLRIILENLLNNAWKFTSNRLYACIEFCTILQTDSQPAYFVRDNDAGFDMAYANKLFRAFQRLHSCIDRAV